MAHEYTTKEISLHNRPNDLYIIIDDVVYDVTNFQHEHPGGKEFLIDQGGLDVSELFDEAGHSDIAIALLPDLRVGVLERKDSFKPGPFLVRQEKPVQSYWPSGLHMLIALLAAATVLSPIVYFMSSQNDWLKLKGMV